MPTPRHTAKLKDGTRIAIRPISPDDRQALAEGFERLSPESRYRRFFGPVPQLREHELDYLTQVDHHDHEALVVVDEATSEGVAVARFVRLDADTAEPAIVVSDEWQRRGVAGHLLAALADRARDEGIRRFIAPVLADNAGAIAAFHRLGAATHDPMGREVELTVDLTEPARGQPLLRELLRGLASGALEPARGAWELLLRQRPAPPGFGRAIVVAIAAGGGAPTQRHGRRGHRSVAARGSRILDSLRRDEGASRLDRRGIFAASRIHPDSGLRRLERRGAQFSMQCSERPEAGHCPEAGARQGARGTCASCS